MGILDFLFGKKYAECSGCGCSIHKDDILCLNCQILKEAKKSNPEVKKSTKKKVSKSKKRVITDDEQYWIDLVDGRVNVMPLNSDATDLSFGCGGVDGLGMMHFDEYKSNESRVPEDKREEVALDRLEGFSGIRDYIQSEGSKEQKFHLDASIKGASLYASSLGINVEKLSDKNKVPNISELRVHEDELEDVGIVTHYNGKPFSGIMYKLWDNGNLETEHEMIDGLKHGINRNYHENGKIWEEINYKNDKEHPIKDGVLRTWHDNGQLFYETPYSNEKRNGLRKVWNENGTLREEIEYKDNEIISEIHYDQNGNEIPHGKKHGPVKFYHPNGNLEVEGNWNNEKQDGLWSWFWENGKLEKQIEFKDGEMLSEKFYNENGIAIDKQQYQQILDNHDDYEDEDEDGEDEKITTNENADFIKEISQNWRKFLLDVTEIECDEKEELADTKFDIYFCDSNFCNENEDVIFKAREMQIKIWYKEDGEWHEGDTTYYPELICGDDKDNDYETYIFFNTPNANPELGNGWSNTGEMTLSETVTFLENIKTLDYNLLSEEEKNDFAYFSITKTKK